MKRALVIGANGTIGRALINELSGLYDVVGLSREDGDYSEQAFVRWRDEFASDQPFSLVICCVGVLHNHRLTPERKLDQLTADSLLEYFRINSVIPALCIKFFGPLLDKAAVSKFVCLSAMVGSISDNKLGGWYGYRASKAALNMIVKTASIELARVNRRACLVAFHPGTTRGPLSAPYAKSVADNKYYTPQQSAQRIVGVTESLQSDQTGSFLNWTGTVIDW